MKSKHSNFTVINKYTLFYWYILVIFSDFYKLLHNYKIVIEK